MDYVCNLNPDQFQRRATDDARKVHCNLHGRQVWTKVTWTSNGVQYCDRCYRFVVNG